MNKYNFYFLCDGKAKSFQHNLNILKTLGGSFKFEGMNGVHEGLKGNAMYIDSNNQVQVFDSPELLESAGCECVNWYNSTSHHCYYICDRSHRSAEWYIKELEEKGGIFDMEATNNAPYPGCWYNDTFFYIDSLSHIIKWGYKSKNPELLHLLILAGYEKCIVPRQPRIVQWKPSVKDEVLCRNTDGVWDLCQFAYMTAQGTYSVVGGRQYEQILPYREATRKFLGAVGVPRLNYQVNAR